MGEGGLGDAGLEVERHSFVDKERKFYKILRCVNCHRPAPPDLRRENGRECSHHGLDVDWENEKWQQFDATAKGPSHTIEAIVMVQFVVAIGDVTNMEDDPCHLLWIHTAIPFLDVLKQVLRANKN